MPKVCLTNDDGSESTGLLTLAETLSPHVEVVIVVPDGERSASGKALTLNRPIRLKKRTNTDGIEMIIHDGSPADSVVLARCLVEDIDMFVSGINAGANLGYQSMLTSGTVGAALEAALMGFPAIAVSLVVEPNEWFNSADKKRDYTKVCEITRDLVLRVLEKGLPKTVDALNLNFPSRIPSESRIVVVPPARVRIYNELEKRVDPNESPYYWLKGMHKDAPQNSDADVVLNRGNIALSPIVIETADTASIEDLRDFMSD
ncbi:MAG: 5'/3'-nucleotidase SurE [Candidatus Thorarchaeota archaeon]|nr:MAG: 5'/3'-nucleotidase SurE [Candidatus Thorarchaeota archaeon]